jgi:serine/threonine-protein kinase
LAKVPAQIDKYELVRRLGHGGMGTVYLGRDPDLDRLVAIKVLRDPLFDEELLQRFLREARAAANLRHENIITVYDVGQHDHQPFMAMEYVEGLSLGELIRGQQPLTLGDKLSYIEQICSGLAFAHAKGIVHRDIKPANLMIDRRNMIRILDFGIARVEGSGMTSDGALIGTLNYMSPEQMLGRTVDHRSDIFAVGTVAYELLAYQQAFPGTLEDGLLNRLPLQDPQPLAELCPGLPDGLEAIISKALAKQPDQRFADLDQTRAAIRDIRRHIDPQLQLDPITLRSGATRRSEKGTPSPASTNDRRELLERRARQIAMHREAARGALERQDLESAIAACEDALTLDPDDREALQLQAQIQQTRQQREQESKERHDRDRAQRQRLADAELKLSRGDVAGAAGLLQQVLAVNPHDPVALALVPRVQEAARTAGVAIPEIRPAAPELTMLADRRPAPRDPGTATPDATRRAHAATGTGAATLAHERPAATSSRLPWLIVGGIAAAAAVIAAVVWVPRDRPSAPPLEKVSSAPVQPSPAPTTPAAKAGDNPAAPPVTSSPVTPPPVTPGAPRAVDTALADQIARVNMAYTNGDLAGALRLIEPVLATTDNEQTRGLALRIAQRGRESMVDAEHTATTQKAGQLARETFASASQAKARAEQAFERRDYVQAARQALTAGDAFRKSAQEATTAALRATPVAPPPGLPAATPATTAAITPSAPANIPPPVTTSPAPAPAPTPTPAASASPAAIVPPPVAAPRPDTAILRALGRYQDAYRDLSVKALKEVYPKLPREAGQKLERQFKNCRAFEVTFLSPQVSAVAGDATAANVNVRSTYSCQPKNAQSAQAQSVQEIFAVRKFGDDWVIESIFSN